ncbi:MAG: hypothetical protein CVU11_16480 [Bacteroidetes bacterium HGW-Bacteroidetes-6]|nr:MAG: hypothetical protein CVU11_16480 [Bacteroidetes bacterium HGW-Bacteroidetes-6]
MIAIGIHAQNIGIATTAIVPDASSMLEVQSTNKGLLIPRVALTATNVAGPIASPATSLLVYNTATAGAAPNNVTPGYYFNAGTPAVPNWTRLLGGKEAWLTTGNLGTTAAINWLGTNDAQDFATRTNNVERTRILSAGNILFNRTTTVVATDLFEAQGNATFPDAINGYTDQSSGIGVFGGNTTATGAGAGAGVYGLSWQTGSAGTVGDGATATRGVLGITTNATYAGVQGQNNDAAGDGVYGINAAATGAGGGAGVYGYSEQTGAAGVFGNGGSLTRGVIGLNSNATYAAVHAQNGNLDGDAIFAYNSAASGAGAGTGIYARSDQSGGAGAWGATANAGGIGMIAQNGGAAGNNIGDGLDAWTSQSQGMGVFAMNYNASGTGIIAGANGLTAFYLPEGSGGAFSGQYFGSYGFAIDSITSRTSYTQNATGVFGKAVFNRNANVDFYHFGVYGEYFDNNAVRNGRRSGGVLGFAQNSGSGNMWGSLGYLSSGSVLYGAYYSTTIATGAGKSPNEPSASIGFGAEGGFMGGHVNGSEYGLVVSAKRAAMVIEGETYSTGYYAVLNKNEEGDYTTSYAAVSSRPSIYASGTATVVNGTATIQFDEAFSQIASSENPVVVTVTPMGPSNGLYVKSCDVNGFVVNENKTKSNQNEEKGANNTSVTFSWIAVATVKNQETPQVPSELKTGEFHSNLDGFIKNESNSADTQYYLWWDGTNLRYDEPQVSSVASTPSTSIRSKEQKQSTLGGFQMRQTTTEIETRNNNGAANATQIQKINTIQNNSTIE